MYRGRIVDILEKDVEPKDPPTGKEDVAEGHACPTRPILVCFRLCSFVVPFSNFFFKSRFNKVDLFVLVPPLQDT